MLFFACARLGAVAVAMSPRYREGELVAIGQGSELRAVATVGEHEGWDFPACRTLILARPTRSLIRYIQMAGRVLRPHASKTRALILDLRLNHGGNGNLRTRLVRELIRAEDADTRLFVLTWRGTFSASQFILDDLDRLTDAVFVGEPASSKPSSSAKSNSSR